jgi:hypothetical protein
LGFLLRLALEVCDIDRAGRVGLGFRSIGALRRCGIRPRPRKFRNADQAEQRKHYASNQQWFVHWTLRRLRRLRRCALGIGFGTYFVGHNSPQLLVRMRVKLIFRLPIAR